MNPCVPPKSRRSGFLPDRDAFSLVEVTIALGIVAFSVLSLIGLLPGGLRTVRDSATETAISAIVRQMRAELNQASFSDVTTTLPTQTWYFNEAGLELDASAPTTDRFFELKFAAQSPSASGAAPDFDQSASAVTMTASYPIFAPSALRRTNTISILVARQTSR
ncbi:MAG: Verru_Chthon cassette protein B [Chthoniobacteraceae bacterium]